MNDTDYDKRLGKRLRTLREIHRMTQADLGVQVGLSHQQIQKYEGGQSQIRASLAHRFAELFNIEVGQLMNDSDMIAIKDRPFVQSAAISTQVAEPNEPSAPFLDNDIVRLVTLFSQIKSPQQRAAILDLAASLNHQ
jgi:transcriptional regulator with XRE-family HTH domain